METTYRGNTITYNESDNLFECIVEGHGTLTHETLAGVRAKVDRLDAEDVVKQPKQNGIEIVKDYDKEKRHDVYRVGDVTIGTFGRLRRYGSNYIYVWVTRKDSRGRVERERVDALSKYQYDIYQDTPENRALLTEIVAKKNAIEVYSKKMMTEVYDLEEKLATEKAKPAISHEDLPIWDK